MERWLAGVCFTMCSVELVWYLFPEHGSVLLHRLGSPNHLICYAMPQTKPVHHATDHWESVTQHSVLGHVWISIVFFVFALQDFCSHGFVSVWAQIASNPVQHFNKWIRWATVNHRGPIHLSRHHISAWWPAITGRACDHSKSTWHLLLLHTNLMTE